MPFVINETFIYICILTPVIVPSKDFESIFTLFKIIQVYICTKVIYEMLIKYR